MIEGIYGPDFKFRDGRPIMPWETFDFDGKVSVINGERFVRIPEEVVLVGEDILIRQDKDGSIVMYPTSYEGRCAIRNYHPLGDFPEDDELEEPNRNA
jgi:virulence-associated protein VagC